MGFDEIKFSDLLLFADGTARLKGCPNTGSHLIPMPDGHEAELIELRQTLSDLDHSVMRLRFGEAYYRVERIDDVDGQRIWFLRKLEDTVRDFCELGLNPVVTNWLIQQRHGLVLFAGAQASGKTTTASSYVCKKLSRDGGHGVTFEFPAELPLAGPQGKFGYCIQTEIANETELAQKIERAHRYSSPDVIFIGEIRTKYAALEALRIALGSNRQLVVATIHGQDVPSALDRLVSGARELDGDNVCQNLADALLAILHLTLESDENGSLCLSTSQYLLLPFNEEAKGIRSKLRDGKFCALADDIRQLKARIANKKELGI